MWRVKAGSVEVDLCPGLAAQLIQGQIVRLTSVRGTARMQDKQGQWEEVILPSHVERIERVRVLHPTCDEHKAGCP